MKTTNLTLVILLACGATGVAFGQDKTQPTPPRADSATAHEPPAQAYSDCLGKKAGDTVQHTTREGKVAATCEDSPKGLVARPKQTQGG